MLSMIFCVNGVHTATDDMSLAKVNASALRASNLAQLRQTKGTTGK